MPIVSPARRARATIDPRGGSGHDRDAPGRRAQTRATATIHHANREPSHAVSSAAKPMTGTPRRLRPPVTRERNPAIVAGSTAGLARAFATTDHPPRRGSMATSTGVHASWATSGTRRAVSSTLGARGQRTLSRLSRIGTANMIAVVEITERTKPTEDASIGRPVRSRLTVPAMTATGEIPPPRRKTTATAIAIPAALIALGSTPTMKT
ncbi:Uncharacterised protein [Mycobacteroides abscessus subsp. abscessus]|nr:Uncharacterised protein [Mycobacteroides abscessus subsp. abscessus]